MKVTQINESIQYRTMAHICFLNLILNFSVQCYIYFSYCITRVKDNSQHILCSVTVWRNVRLLDVCLAEYKKNVKEQHRVLCASVDTVGRESSNKK